LSNASVLNDRIEKIGIDSEYRASFSIVTARAVSNLSTLLEYSLPLLKVGGIFVAYKTENDLKELSRLDKVLEVLGGKYDRKYYYSIPGKDFERVLMIFKKEKHTPDTYPRDIGIPEKKPL
jgi:16S rRNA (guanine527-N7)-methyltransferase